MTKLQCLQKFFSSFGIPAIEENSFYSSTVVPDFPYITYNAITGEFLSGEITLNPSVWYSTYSLGDLEKKVTEISKALGDGVTLSCNDGFLWFKKGNPFCEYMGDPENKFIKRAYLSIIVEYFTTV